MERPQPNDVHHDRISATRIRDRASDSVIHHSGDGTNVDGQGCHRDSGRLSGGLRRCADTERGDLSSFVIQAMLENYEAAKEDRRAMCGDTGVPRWYVKYGNEAQPEGG